MIHETDWCVPPSDLELSLNQVHIWHASLKATSEQLCRSWAVLSPDEMRRAERLHHDSDRRHFVVARALLRNILSAYSRCEPRAVLFAYSPYGKPSLVGGQPLRFSISYSGGHALYAVTLERDIGIDIEYKRPIRDADQIVERFFSREEKLAFHSLLEGSKDRAFLNCWTRKEAYLKALGTGLSHPLDAFSVTLLPGEPAGLKPAECNARASPEWTIKDICVHGNCVAAVVVGGCNLDFLPWRLSW
jgi:4'-phosphopantetheinyl transferase